MEGYSEGGDLSSLLWSMFLNALQCELQNLLKHTQAYADDVCMRAVD